MQSYIMILLFIVVTADLYDTHSITLFKFIPDVGKLWPVLLFWPAGTYTNLNSDRELSERPFFLRDHGWQWFSKK